MFMPAAVLLSIARRSLRCANPLVGAGLSQGSVISASSSIVSLPIYDSAATYHHSSPGYPASHDRVGFLQVFINQVDRYGNVSATVLNVAGCGNGANSTTERSCHRFFARSDPLDHAAIVSRRPFQPWRQTLHPKSRARREARRESETTLHARRRPRKTQGAAVSPEEDDRPTSRQEGHKDARRNRRKKAA